MYLEQKSQLGLFAMNFVSISFGDLMYLELKGVKLKNKMYIVSISFGDLMYLEQILGTSLD